MSEDLHLTNDQLWAVKTRAHKLGVDLISVNSLGLIVQAINEELAPKPDPMNTVRLRPDYDQYAIKGKDGWHLIAPSLAREAGYQFHKGDFPRNIWDGLTISEWPIVYTPEQ